MRALYKIQNEIDSLKSTNKGGCNNEKIAELIAEKELAEVYVRSTMKEAVVYQPTELEKQAIKAFYKDKRFSITE